MRQQYIIALSLLFPIALFAQQFFGKVVYDITDSEGRYQLTAFIAEDQSRIDFQNLSNGKQTSLIFSRDQIFVVDHSNKTAVQLTTLPPQFAQLVNPVDPSLLHFPSLPASSLETLKQGGRVIQRLEDGTTITIDQAGTKTVSGHQCQQWIFQNEKHKQRVEVCLAQGLGTFFLTPELTETLRKKFQHSPIADRLFPLEIRTYRNDELQSAIVVTEIDHSPPPDSVFEIPKSYKMITVPLMNTDQ